MDPLVVYVLASVLELALAVVYVLASVPEPAPAMSLEHQTQKDHYLLGQLLGHPAAMIDCLHIDPSH